MVDEEIELGPTPERLARGRVELLERAQDDAGRVSRPYQAVGLLASLERRGAITAEARQAGEDFQQQFAIAQLDPLKASDHERAMVSGRRIGHPGIRAEWARESVWLAIVAIGGLGSVGGSCLWHVLGWQQSLTEWAKEQGWTGRRVSQENATGILIVALEMLERHYEKKSLTRSRR